MSSNQTFVGRIATKNKAELSEILKALGQDALGKKNEMEERLEKYLQDNESTLKNDDQYKGLYVQRRKRRSAREVSDSPVSSGEHGDELEPLKEGVADMASKTYEAASQAYDQTIKPTVETALEEGQQSAVKSARKMSKRAKDAIGLDDDVFKTPQSATRAARAGASKAIEIAKPAMKNGVEQTSQAVEKVQHDGLQYWQQSGRAQVGLCIKDTQEYLSDSTNLVKVSLALELIFLLYPLVMTGRHQIQIPPSEFSQHASARLLHSLLWWMPEYRFDVKVPDLFGMVKPSSAASAGLVIWLVATVLPPYLLSHLISFLPQPSARSRHQQNGSSVPPLPHWDPLVFCLTRLALVLLPLTSAAPDMWRYQLEAIGNLSGRALAVALTTALVLADRLGALAV